MPLIASLGLRQSSRNSRRSSGLAGRPTEHKQHYQTLNVPASCEMSQSAAVKLSAICFSLTFDARSPGKTRRITILFQFSIPMLVTPLPRQPQQRGSVPPDHAALTTRALSNTNPARSYICRFPEAHSQLLSLRQHGRSYHHRSPQPCRRPAARAPKRQRRPYPGPSTGLMKIWPCSISRFSPVLLRKLPLLKIRTISPHPAFDGGKHGVPSVAVNPRAVARALQGRGGQFRRPRIWWVTSGTQESRRPEYREVG